MPEPPESVVMDPEAQRALASDLFNYCWTLLEKDDRTERETELMIHAAHASRFFWEAVGEPVNHARGEWQISRAYAVARRPEPALHHAELCLAICEAHAIGAYDLAYAYEAIARAHAVAGRRAESLRWGAQARAAAERIEDEDDRDLLLSDVASLAHGNGETA
jgi:hypothetical protein